MCIILWISLFLGFLSESISNLFEVGTGYLFPGRPWTFCQRLVELIGRTYRDYADSDPHFYRHSVFSDSNGLSINVSIISKNKSAVTRKRHWPH